MTAWEYLLKKGSGATALAILLSGITATNTWDALVQKSSAPNGSTAWVHLVSVLDQVEAPTVGGGGYVRPATDTLRDKYLSQALREDDELLQILRAILEKI